MCKFEYPRTLQDERYRKRLRAACEQNEYGISPTVVAKKVYTDLIDAVSTGVSIKKGLLTYNVCKIYFFGYIFFYT